MKTRRSALILAFSLLVPAAAAAEVFTSVDAGDWSDTLTWGAHRFPVGGDTVIVGHNVNVDYNEHFCACLTITSAGSIYTGYGYRNLTVSGDMVADGEIRSGSWPLTLHVYGDLTLNAEMRNYDTYFEGVSDQTITMGAGGLLAPTRLYGRNTGGLLAATALRCSTMADLGGKVLLLEPGTGIDLEGGWIENGSIVAAGEPLTFRNGAHVNQVTVSDPVLRGEARVYGNVVFTGTAVVEDTLHPHYGSDYLTVEDIENDGVIENTNWGLYVDVLGTLTNRGVWNTQSAVLAGTGDQNARFDDTYPVGAALTLSSGLGGTGHYWTRDDVVVSGETDADCELAPAGTAHHGVWQCHSSEGDSRLFVLGGVNNTAVAGGAPRAAMLVGNRPNPFNPVTTIRFTLAEAAHARLDIFDARGRLVETLVDGATPAGDHDVTWDASGLASGLYFYRLDAGAERATGRCALVR